MNINLKPIDAWNNVQPFGIQNDYFAPTKESWGPVRKTIETTQNFKELIERTEDEDDGSNLIS